MQKMNDNGLYCCISHCITIATTYIIIAMLAEVLVKFKGERNTHSTDFHLKYPDWSAGHRLIKLYKLISSGARKGNTIHCSRSLIYSQCCTMKTCSLHCFISFWWSPARYPVKVTVLLFYFPFFTCLISAPQVFF